MGHIVELEGPIDVEVRRESFYLQGDDGHIYTSGGSSVELLIEDIPAIRAALDAVEEHVRKVGNERTG